MADPKAASPNYNPYGKAAKNETKAAAAKRKSKYYSFQREHAEETGDQKTVDKIYGKLGKKSPDVDADSVNKKALAYGPALAAGGSVGLGRALAGRAAATAAPIARAVMKKLPSGNRLPGGGASAGPKALPGKSSAGGRTATAGAAATAGRTSTTKGAAARSTMKKATDRNASRSPSMRSRADALRAGKKSNATKSKPKKGSR